MTCMVLAVPLCTAFTLHRESRVFVDVNDRAFSLIQRGQKQRRRYTSSRLATSLLFASIQDDQGHDATIVDDSFSTSSISFDKFDYLAHWCPVAWARDVPYNTPTKITVFDTDYVISRRKIPTHDSIGGLPQNHSDPNDEIIALLDRCPHRSASLSEGRISPCGSNFQCAYHGWSFDGKSGARINNPQVSTNSGGKSLRIGGGGSVTPNEAQLRSDRADATAIPAIIQQGMVYIIPGGSLENALLAPLPPRVPHHDGLEFVPVVRDLPVDWTILIDNILDPENGASAPQIKALDKYSTVNDLTQTIEEKSVNDGRGWVLRSRIKAVSSLQFEQTRRKAGIKVQPKRKGKEQILTSLQAYYAPYYSVTARRFKDGTVKIQTPFWICPVGTGRSRLMSGHLGKTRFASPRWLAHIAFNQFLDQDSHLLVTAQKYILSAEAKATADWPVFSEKKAINKKDRMRVSNVRKNLFVYGSSLDKMHVRLCAFFDQTLHRVPNRLAALRTLRDSVVLQPTTSRDVSLDRYEQHTRICQDSADVVRNCNQVVWGAKCGSFVLVLMKILLKISTLNRRKGAKLLFSRVNRALSPLAITILLTLATTLSFIADKIRGQFYAVKPKQDRDKDTSIVPSLWKFTAK